LEVVKADPAVAPKKPEAVKAALVAATAAPVSVPPVAKELVGLTSQINTGSEEQIKLLQGQLAKLL